MFITWLPLVGLLSGYHFYHMVVSFTVKCTILEDLENGYLTCSLGDDGIFSYQDTCSYTCGNGYKLTGSSVVICGSNGQWNVTSIPYCIKGMYEC